MRNLIVSLLFVATLAFANRAQTKNLPAKTAAPTVIRNQEAASKKASKIDVDKLGLTFEKYVSNYEINGDGTSVQTIEALRRFDSAFAAKKYNYYEHEFNAALETVEVLDAYTLDANNKKIVVAPDDIQIRSTPQTEAAPSFSSVKSARINFGRLKIGDLAFYKVRIERKKPYFEKHFDAVEALPALFTWKSAEINLSAPADFELFIEAVDLEGGALPDKGDDRKRWQWRKNNFEALEREYGSTSFIDFSPRLAISSFKSYDELGAAYWAEAQKKSIVTTEIKQLAEEITKDIVEPKAQAYAIYEWTNKNIRYLSVIMERGGWIPHKASEILANRYGDCKDYTTLLHALLAAKNIESFPVLIRATGDYWFPAVAASEYFNHAILYIPSLELFADATAPNTRLGLIPQTIIGKTAFLAGSRTGKIIVPPGKPEDTQILSDTTINFTPEGAARSTTKNTYMGRSEMIYRPLFADSQLQQNSESFVQTILAAYGIAGKGRLLNVSNPHRVEERFNVEVTVDLDAYTNFKFNRSLSIPVGVNLQNLLRLEKFVQSETRRTNLIFGASTFRENFKLNFPQGIVIESAPASSTLENEVGKYRADYKIENNTVLLTREFVAKKDVIVPAEYPALCTLIKKLVADANSEINYKTNVNFQKNAKTKMPFKHKPAVTLDRIMEEALGLGQSARPLKSAEVARLETVLNNTPDDFDVRKQLLRHYIKGRATSTKLQAQMRHRVWLIQNRPQSGDDQIYGLDRPFYRAGSEEYKTLRTEWLKQMSEKPDDPDVRWNIINFVNDSVDKEFKERLLIEGQNIFPDDYRFAIKLFELYAEDWTDWSGYGEALGAEKVEETKSENKNAIKKKLADICAQGEKALELLKKERSDARDSERGDLLPKLAKIAFDSGRFDKAKIYATELILEFGNDYENRNFDQAVHIGNIVLGRLALKENDLNKAKEYLLIAGRAPLRSKYNHVDPNLTLVQELFAKGERQAATEYLKMCEKFKYVDAKTLQRWQAEIKAGKTPSFNKNEFYN